MAIACLRLVTLFPLLPLLSVPRLRLRIARSTSLDAPREYRRAIVVSLSDDEWTRFAPNGVALLKASQLTLSCRPSVWGIDQIETVCHRNPHVAHSDKKLVYLSVARFFGSNGTFSRFSPAITDIVWHHRLRMIAICISVKRTPEH
jgi:hypothetical protein